MGPTAWIVLPIVALLTAVLSAVIGMGGGIVLIGVMLLFLAPALAIGMHGVVQLVSNATRLLAFRHDIVWPLFWRYAIGVIPGVAVCGLIVLEVYDEANRPWLMLGLGAFVLLAMWMPQRRAGDRVARGDDESAPRSYWSFALVGAMTGFLSPLVGATGPVTAPFFLRAGLVKEPLIATKAMCQAIAHLAKLGLFAIVGRTLFKDVGDVRPEQALALVALLSVAVIGGTLWGKRLVKRVSPRGFVILFRTVVTIIALKLALVDGVYQLFLGR